MDFGGFIGRFHPLFVHLPIGLLILAGVFEYLGRKPKYQKLQQAVTMTLFIGALSAIFSSVSGWLLANRGAYIEQSLFLHRWLGIAVAVFATLCWLIKTKRLNLSTGIFNGLLGVMVLGVFATGHFGGAMTHGDDYLVEYAPAFLKNILGKKEAEAGGYDFENVEDIQVYQDLLRPVFEDKCWKCHNPNNALGGLDMSTKEAFLKGGLTGSLVEKGAAYESLLFTRITLPASDRKAMPPVGLPLPYDQIRLIEWWINAGASFEEKLDALEMPSAIKRLLTEVYGISFLQRSAIESIEVAPANPEALKNIRQKGFNVNSLAEGNNLLELSVNIGKEERSTLDFLALVELKNQITWLDVSASSLDVRALAVIAQCKNLTRLKLNENPIADSDLKTLETLPLLESLNLIGTKITDQGLESIRKMPALKTVFLWQTEVSEAAINQLEEERPDLEIVRGFQFENTKDGQ